MDHLKNIDHLKNLPGKEALEHVYSAWIQTKQQKNFPERQNRTCIIVPAGIYFYHINTG